MWWYYTQVGIFSAHQNIVEIDQHTSHVDHPHKLTELKFSKLIEIQYLKIELYSKLVGAKHFQFVGAVTVI